MADRYKCFQDLAAANRLGVDYRIRAVDRGAPVVIVAPHGGRIEPHTSLIAEAIAGQDFSLYLFESLRNAPHSAFHITSSRFDEPIAIDIVGRSITAIAIHGRSGYEDNEIWLGGRALILRESINKELNAAGFDAAFNSRLPGLDKSNICNRTLSGEGVQLEIPRGVRDRLKEDYTQLNAFCLAICKSVNELGLL